MDQQKLNKLKKLMKYNISLNNKDCAIFYVEQEISDKFKFLSRLQSEKIKFIFPVKSFPSENILKMANDYLAGFDISNILEYDLVKNLITSDSILWNSCPYLSKSPVGICDINDISKVENSDISLRINATSFNDYDSRFGIAPELIKDILINNKKINKLHIHMGGEENTVKSYMNAINYIRDTLKDINSDENFVINLGGGFGNFKFHDVEEVINYAKNNLNNHLVIFEPGRWLSQESGYAYSKIIGKTQSNDCTNLIMALSPSCHLKWFRGKFDVYFENNGKNIEKYKKIKLCGGTCFENDILAEVHDVSFSLSGENYCLISNVSGYSYAWNTSFNGIDKAHIIFLKGAI